MHIIVIIATITMARKSIAISPILTTLLTKLIIIYIRFQHEKSMQVRAFSKLTILTTNKITISTLTISAIHVHFNLVQKSGGVIRIKTRLRVATKTKIRVSKTYVRISKSKENAKAFTFVKSVQIAR